MGSLETDRLALSPVAGKDAAATARLVCPDVSRNLASWPSPLSIEQAQARIAASMAAFDRREAVDLAITRRADRQLIGWVGLARTDLREARLGYWLGAEFRGQGLAKEAVAAMIEPYAEYLGVDNLVAYVLRGNLASVAILNGVGFRFEREEARYMEVRRRYEPCLRFVRRAP